VDEGFIKGLAEGLHVVPDRLSFDKGWIEGGIDDIPIPDGILDGTEEGLD
jgi:hypothetical protein